MSSFVYSAYFVVLSVKRPPFNISLAGFEIVPDFEFRSGLLSRMWGGTDVRHPRMRAVDEIHRQRDVLEEY